MLVCGYSLHSNKKFLLNDFESSIRNFRKQSYDCYDCLNCDFFGFDHYRNIGLNPLTLKLCSKWL